MTATLAGSAWRNHSRKARSMERDRSYANSVVRACDVLKSFRRDDETDDAAGPRHSRNEATKNLGAQLGRVVGGNNRVAYTADVLDFINGGLDTWNDAGRNLPISCLFCAPTH